MTKRLAGFLATAVLASFAPQAPAAMVTTNYGEYSVTYDDATTFGGIAFNSSGGGNVGFGWKFATSSVNVENGVLTGSTTIALPEFTIMANSGYALSGALTGFLGNFSYTKFGPGSSVAVSVTGQVSVDNGSPVSLPPLNLTASSSSSFSGTFAGTLLMASGGFSSVKFSSGVLTATLNAPAGLALLDTQPQNTFNIGFNALSVPEPEAYLLFLAGLGLIGAIAGRRRG